MAPLSKREREVAHLIARGLTNKQIARELFVTEQTIKNHAMRIYDKLNLRSRVDLVLSFARAGILPEPSEEIGR